MRRAPDGLTVHHLDDLDRGIIEELQENGRTPNAAIARTLGVTETTIRNRIERLISGGFLRIAAVIDHRKTAYQVDAVIWMRLDRRRARAAAARIASFPNVVYVGHTTGRYDLLVEALFASDEEMFEFLTTGLSESWGVQQTETCHILRTEKINYDWKVPLDHRFAGRGREARAARGRPGRSRAAGRAGRDRPPGAREGRAEEVARPRTDRETQ
jgi:Lrp/AsnC family transcriptional regulator for asnA, asnC and gidA